MLHPLHRVLLALVAVATLSLVSTVDAYATAGQTGFNAAKLNGISLPRKGSNLEGFFVRKSFARPNKVRYNLGVGKNFPVGRQDGQDGSPSSPPAPMTSAYEACRYFVEHQAVREYPRPTLNQKEVGMDGKEGSRTDHVQEETPIGATVQGAKKQEIQYNRRSEDLLTILVDGHGAEKSASGMSHRPKPTMVAHTTEKFNLNTPWVEMMLMHMSTTS